MGFGTVIVDLLSNFYGLSKNEIKSTKEVARGLGTHIKWMLLEDGLMEAEKNGRPIMVVIHKSTCRACLQFKPKIASCSDVARLSSGFVMINLADEEEKLRDDLAPDGTYVPRILFLNPKGQVLLQVTNRIGNFPERYYYPNTDELIVSMVQVLNMYPLRC
ncbi:thioredoxin domain-containing protein 12-like [Rhodnius prolixus]|uniref:Putative endoplasmic reticulum protein 19 panstrongylus lignarius n=1 Tax=Rhodnius prolixus TaxID=13249 RepID=A0A4P6D8J7_RHOPR